MVFTSSVVMCKNTRVSSHHFSYVHVNSAFLGCDLLSLILIYEIFVYRVENLEKANHHTYIGTLHVCTHAYAIPTRDL